MLGEMVELSGVRAISKRSGGTFCRPNAERAFGPAKAGIEGAGVIQGTFGSVISTHAGGNGGAERNRTAGLLIANEALSQLSYSPEPVCR